MVKVVTISWEDGLGYEFISHKREQMLDMIGKILYE